ncbi:unnamed protein product [Alternaria alternata]
MPSVETPCNLQSRHHHLRYRRTSHTRIQDVELYKNRTAEGFRNRGKAGVPGAEAVKKEENPSTSSPAANKNAKRREAREKAAAAADDGKDEGKGASADVKEKEASVEVKAKENAKPEADKVVDPEVEKEKEAKKLTKKLRQARELKDKKDKGDKLLPEQFEKVIKINELIRQLESLGFDAQGEKKGET